MINSKKIKEVKMQKVFDEVNSLDKKCYEEFGLTEDLLMEHAALSIKNFIDNTKIEKSKILVVCGVGNNGADGIALARLLFKEYTEVNLYIPFDTKSEMAKLQLKRAQLLGVNIVKEIENADIVVDCLFGSGLNKPLNEKGISIINRLNSMESYKIACDIPSGINRNGVIENVAFIADTTITMGALKTSLFSDLVKDHIGSIEVATLGLSRNLYENDSNTFLLDKKDLQLPFRKKDSCHKGTFGHSSIIIGCKKGAGIIACNASFAFGSGLVTAVVHEELDLPYHIMQSHKLPSNTTSIAIGMGLGLYEKSELKKILDTNIKKVIDADLFYNELILDVLEQDVVLTPHPKEFCSLLKLCDIADISTDTLQKNRFKYTKEFCLKYPKATLLLKGANTLISKSEKIYINSLGTASLSKGGSGDVLSGLISSLLAQGFNSLDSAIHASLAHSIASANYSKNNYSLTPQDLIEEIKVL